MSNCDCIEPADRSSATNRQLEGRHILQLPGWKRTDTLIVENNSAFELRLRESLLDAIVMEESIPEWQRGYLPKSNNHYMFRFDEPSSDGMTLNGPMTKYEPNKLESSISLSDPPALEWISIPNRLKAKVTTEIGWGRRKRGHGETPFAFGSRRGPGRVDFRLVANGTCRVANQE